MNWKLDRFVSIFSNSVINIFVWILSFLLLYILKKLKAKKEALITKKFKSDFSKKIDIA